MNIRKINLPADIDPLMDVSLAAFQYPENPEWSIDTGEAEELRDQVRKIRRFWPLLRVGMLFSETLRHLFDGYICEDEGKMVGTLMYQRRPAKTPVFYISNVAVHPQQRRRGIARQLVEAALAEMRSQGNCQVMLDVIAGNVPAYRLYESLGWEHFSGTVHFLLGAGRRLPQTTADGGYEALDLSNADWRIPFEFAERVTPPRVRKFVPVTADQYKPNRAFAFLDLLSGMKEGKFYLRNRQTGQVAGYGKYHYQNGAHGNHHAILYLDPSEPAAAAPLIDTVC